MKRIQTKYGRFYVTTDNRYLPSVTTIINRYHKKEEHLIKWIAGNGYEESQRIKKEAADYGTYIHIVFSRILEGNSIDLSTIPLQYKDYAKQDIFGFLTWIHDYKIIPLQQNLSIAGLLFAGSIDLLCYATIDDIQYLVIVDFKKGRKAFYEEYEIQLSGYLQLYYSHINKPFMSKNILIANYRCKDFKLPLRSNIRPYEFKIQKYNNKWTHYLTMWYQDIGEFKPKKEIIIKDCVVSKENFASDMLEEKFEGEEENDN